MYPATLHRAVATFALCAIATLVGCGGAQREYPKTPNMNAKRYSNLEKLAEKEISCPVAQLKYEYRGDNIHRMSGCSTYTDFLMLCSAGMCQWGPTPTKQGSFDMGCPKEQLTLTRFSDREWGVTGCDKQARYVLACPSAQCTWIANTAAQVTPSASAAPAPAAPAPAAPAPAGSEM